MTPAQFRSILDAATKRPWASYGDNVCALDPFVEFCRIYEIPDCKTQDANGQAIVATMNVSADLVELWDALHSTGCMYRVDSHDKVERKIAFALRRLEEFKP